MYTPARAALPARDVRYHSLDALSHSHVLSSSMSLLYKMPTIKISAQFAHENMYFSMCMLYYMYEYVPKVYSYTRLLHLTFLRALHVMLRLRYSLCDCITHSRTSFPSRDKSAVRASNSPARSAWNIASRLCDKCTQDGVGVWVSGAERRENESIRMCWIVSLCVYV